MQITNTMTVSDLIEIDNFETMWSALTTFLTVDHNNSLVRTTDASYPVYSIADMLKIPTSAVEDYLTDMKPVLKSIHTAATELKALLGAQSNIRDSIAIAPEEFIWTDDNIRKSTLNVEIETLSS